MRWLYDMTVLHVVNIEYDNEWIWLYYMIPITYGMCYMIWMPVLYKCDVIIWMSVKQECDVIVSVYDNKERWKRDYLYLFPNSGQRNFEDKIF